MNDRLKALQRIVKVQTQMQRLAEWRLAASEQRLHGIETARRELDAFIAEPEALGGLAAAAHRQNGRLAVGAAAATVHRDVMAEARLAAERRLKAAETLTDAVRRTARTAEERGALESLVEAAMSRPVASEPEPST